jgi:hypothetical protein
MTDDTAPTTHPTLPQADGEPQTAPARALSPAAERALAEAAARREEYRRYEASRPREIGGRGGHEPGRYGDWEVKGLTADF